MTTRAMTLEEIRKLKEDLKIKPPNENAKPVVLPKDFWDGAEWKTWINPRPE